MKRSCAGEDLMIRKTSGGKYKLYSKKTGKPLSKPGSYSQTVKREKQVEYFKRVKKSGQM
jgi:hypothetical protein